MESFLICGGMVVDGTGSPARGSDVRIRDGRITEIGPRLRRENERVVDAAGAFVAPGFIDSHTHFDASLYWDPLCDPVALHGITTVLIGNCSLGLAPARAYERKTIADMLSYIEDIPSELIVSSVPWNWETYDEYAAVLTAMKLGVNVISLVGHSVLRNHVMGEAAWERVATEEEAALMARTLQQALAAGARGLSCSLFDKDRHGRRVPSFFADDAELELLFEALGAHGGVFQFQARTSELGKKCEDLQRVATMARRQGTAVLDNGVAHLPHEPEWGTAVLDFVGNLQQQGARIYSMLSPNSIELAINFDQTNCFISIPAWNEFIQTPTESKRSLLTNAQWRERARSDFDSCADTLMFPTNRLHDIRVIGVGRPELSDWIGRSLQDLVNERHGHPSDVMADWVLDNDLKPRFANPLTNRDPSAVAPLMKRPGALLSGSDAGAHLQMFCGVGDTTLMLTRYVRERRDFTVEEMIYQLTARQADVLGLSDRGRLAPGLRADVTVFDLAELRYESVKLVDDYPGGASRFRRPPGGYRHTMINGALVQESGRYLGVLPGQYGMTRRPGQLGT